MTGGVHAYQSWCVSSLWGISLHLPQVCFASLCCVGSFFCRPVFLVYHCAYVQKSFAPNLCSLLNEALHHLIQLRGVNFPGPVSWGWRGVLDVNRKSNFLTKWTPPSGCLDVFITWQLTSPRVSDLRGSKMEATLS